MIDYDPLLGEVLAIYPSDRLRLLIPAALICGAAALALGVTFAQVTDWWGPAVTLLGMAAVTLLAGWWVLHRWNREVIVYRRGFTYREGSQVVPLLFNEIKSIHQSGEQLAYFGGRVRRNLYRITMTTVRGEVIVLTNLYRRVGELGELLERLITETLRPRFAAWLEQGETVSFNGLAISAAGIHQGEDHLPWGEFAGYRVQNRRLVIAARGGDWRGVPLNQLDNIVLLLGWLRERLPTQQG